MSQILLDSPPERADFARDDAATSSDRVVRLADGTTCDLKNRSTAELLHLQYRQEQAYAQQFREFPKGSPERAAAFAQGYDTITAIFAAANGIVDGPVTMGLDPRYERLVLRLLRRQARDGVTPRLFEIGYGSGELLKRISGHGYAVGGIEVSPAMHHQAVAAIPERHREQLLLGDFLSHDFRLENGTFSLCYWNDVFEHVPPDEIRDYLTRIRRLLSPGGLLVTITPNWHVRPMDVTAEFHPPRTEAQGVHLKEYTLREVTTLLRSAGFRRVSTPLFVIPGTIALAGGGLAAVKRLLEPSLEWLPYRLAHLLVRGFGLSCTIAQRP